MCLIRIELVLLINFLINFLLLMGTDRLFGYPTAWLATAVAATIGSLYAGMCLQPGFRFLGNLFWKTVSLGVMAGFAFGFSKSGFQRGVVFALLSMALGGIVMGIGNESAIWQLVAAGVIMVLCAIGFQGKSGRGGYVPVELYYNGKMLHLTALYDTGNTLKDPVTGRPVLVIGEDAARALTGLTSAQLRDPVRSMLAAEIPGLRLVPYKTVGQPCAMMLALRLQKVRIGHWEGSSLVAFAPDKLSREGTYQALAGGIL